MFNKMWKFVTRSGIKQVSAKQASILVVLQCAFIALAFLSNVFAVRTIQIGSVTLVLGNLLFPLVYVLSDLIAEFTSIVRVLTLIAVGYALQLLTFAFVLGGGSLFSVVPGNEVGANALSVVFSFIPIVVLASFAGVLGGNLINALILRGMSSQRFGFKTRAFVSTIGGEVLDTWLFLAVLGVSGNWLNALAVAGVKIGIEGAILPLTSMARNAIAQKGV